MNIQNTQGRRPGRAGSGLWLARWWALAVLAGGLLGAAAPAGAAANLSVSPTTLVLSPTGRGGGINLTNNGGKPAVVRASLLAWSTHSSGDELAPTDDFLVLPPEFEIAPGATQIVRVARTYRGAAPLTEQAYRLLLVEQLPADRLVRDTAATPVTAPMLQISTRLSISLPIFVLPARPDEAGTDPQESLAWKVVGAGENHLWIEITGRGNVHRKLDSLLARDADDRLLSTQAAPLIYVLPEQTTRFDLPVTRPLRAGETLRLTFNESYRPWSQRLELPSPLPPNLEPPVPKMLEEATDAEDASAGPAPAAASASASATTSTSASTPDGRHP